MKSNSSSSELDIERIQSLLGQDPLKRSWKEIQALAAELKDIAFFKQYQNMGYGDVHVQCSRYLQYEKILRNEAVFQIDTVGDKFYLILKGRVGIYIRLPKPLLKKTEEGEKENLTCVKELETGLSFGELALLNNKPRLASIICHEDSHFMTLDKKSFTLILKQKEEEKLMQEMAFFAKLPFFEGWNYNLIKLIYLNSFRIKYQKNEKIFSEGDDPINVYIVSEGEFVIQKGFERGQEDDEFGFAKSEEVETLKMKSNLPKKQIQLAVLVKNELFGEDDIMNKLPKRTYSVVCSTVQGECIVVKKRDFEIRILHEEGARLYLEDRLRKKKEYMIEKIQKIKGSMGDYQKYFYDDRNEQKQKQLITNAISKIESPRKRRNDLDSLDGSDEERKQNEINLNPGKNIGSPGKNISSPFLRRISRRIKPITIMSNMQQQLLQQSQQYSIQAQGGVLQRSSFMKLGNEYYQTQMFLEDKSDDKMQGKEVSNEMRLGHQFSLPRQWKDIITIEYQKKIEEIDASPTKKARLLLQNISTTSYFDSETLSPKLKSPSRIRNSFVFDKPAHPMISLKPIITSSQNDKPDLFFSEKQENGVKREGEELSPVIRINRDHKSMTQFQELDELNLDSRQKGENMSSSKKIIKSNLLTSSNENEHKLLFQKLDIPNIRENNNSIPSLQNIPDISSADKNEFPQQNPKMHKLFGSRKNSIEKYDKQSKRKKVQINLTQGNSENKLSQQNSKEESLKNLPLIKRKSNQQYQEMFEKLLLVQRKFFPNIVEDEPVRFNLKSFSEKVVNPQQFFEKKEIKNENKQKSEKALEENFLYNSSFSPMKKNNKSTSQYKFEQERQSSFFSSVIKDCKSSSSKRNNTEIKIDGESLKSQSQEKKQFSIQSLKNSSVIQIHKVKSNASIHSSKYEEQTPSNHLQNIQDHDYFSYEIKKKKVRSSHLRNLSMITSPSPSSSHYKSSFCINTFNRKQSNKSLSMIENNSNLDLQNSSSIKKLEYQSSSSKLKSILFSSQQKKSSDTYQKDHPNLPKQKKNLKMSASLTSVSLSMFSIDQVKDKKGIQSNMIFKSINVIKQPVIKEKTLQS